MNFIHLNNKTNDVPPTAGKLLIAEPLLGDPNFSRTVVLLCEHNDEGTIGFVLNQPTTFVLDDIVPDILAPDLPVFLGGPVQPETIHIIHRMPDVLGGIHVAGDIYWGGSYEVLIQLIKSKEYEPSRIKVFIGYSGWSAGQLEKEMEEGTWLLADTKDELVFETDHKDVWKESIGLLGKNYSYLANVPIDPQLN